MLSVTISQSSQAFLGLCGFSVVETFAGKRWWVVSLRMVLVSRMVATHEVQCCIFLNLHGTLMLQRVVSLKMAEVGRMVATREVQRCIS